MTALVIASRLRHTAVVKLLLKVPGIDVNWQDAKVTLEYWMMILIDDMTLIGWMHCSHLCQRFWSHCYCASATGRFQGAGQHTGEGQGRQWYQ